MNVLFIAHYPSLYGSNRSLLDLLDGIDRHEFNPFVALPSEGDLTRELNDRNITYCTFPFKNWMAPDKFKVPYRFLMNIASLPFLLYHIRKWEITHIHTNSSVTPVGAWATCLANLTHTWHVREFGWEDYQLKYDLGRRQFEYWMNKASHIISVSKSIQHTVLRNINAPVSIIYNGVISKQDSLELITNYGVNKNKGIFGIIGLLSPAKGQDQAIKAFAKISKKYPDTELRIAGSGSLQYEQYLKKLCVEFDITDKVKFLGYVNEPFEFYSNIDVVLICSQNEAMGRVTAEAMISGKIIIGLDNKGTQELIENGETGLLYNGSDESLADRMEYVINHDVSDISKKARDKGLDNFLIEDYSGKVGEILRFSVKKTSNDIHNNQ